MGDIDAIAADLVKSPPVGTYWGHILALVEPNRIAGDKYYVPFEVYPMQYYPPYARGMAYALSEDLVAPLGDALFSDRVDPFPYREDVSVGLYLMELARQGEIKVAPQQRKDQMPLDITEYCARGQGVGIPGSAAEAAAIAALAAAAAGTGPPPRLWVLHRFRHGDAPCFWRLIEERRERGLDAQVPVDFCSCLRSASASV